MAKLSSPAGGSPDGDPIDEARAADTAVTVSPSDGSPADTPPADTPPADTPPAGSAPAGGADLEAVNELLAAMMRRQRRRWAIATKAYGIIYYVNRVALILASAVVAAKETLNTGTGKFLVPWIPLLAVGVAALIALDTWLKPQAKWRGFMESRDGLADLLVRSEGGLPVDRTRSEFLALRQRHRERNVF